MDKILEKFMNNNPHFVDSTWVEARTQLSQLFKDECLKIIGENEGEEVGYVTRVTRNQLRNSQRSTLEENYGE